MDRRSILAIILCLGIYLGWQKFYIEPRFQNPPVTTGPSTITNPQTGSNLSPSSAALPSQTGSASTTSSINSAKIRASTQNLPPQRATLKTATGEATLADSGPFFNDWTLKSYRLGISPEAATVDLKSVTHQEGEVTLAFDDEKYLYINDVRGKFTSTANGVRWEYEDSNIKLTRDYSSTEQTPYIDMVVSAEFKTQHPRYAFLSISSKTPEKDPEAQDRQLVYWTNKSIERLPLKDQMNLADISTPVKYIGATNRYFVMALVSESPQDARGLVQSAGPGTGRLSLVYPVTGKSITIPTRVFFGPKEVDILRRVEPTLDHTIDFGWFTLFAYPLLKVLKWLYQFVQNYGVAIILLTLLLKIATYPLTYKSMKSMKKMAKLQPQLKKIQEKYKDDKEALNREMLTMMRSHGYNPMAGCLPMLIQMPIFIALYKVLYSSIELYHAPFMLWIHDLSSHDPFYVTPVLVTVTMFIQQKLTPNTTTDPAQAKMMQLMPIMFGAFMITVPSGLTIYMLVNGFAGIIQQLILNKKFDTAHA